MSRKKTERYRDLAVVVGEQLERHRGHANLRVEEVARSVDISIRFLGEIERGEAKSVTLATIEAIAHVVDWDIRSLLERDDPS